MWRPGPYDSMHSLVTSKKPIPGWAIASCQSLFRDVVWQSANPHKVSPSPFCPSALLKLIILFGLTFRSATLSQPICFIFRSLDRSILSQRNQNPQKCSPSQSSPLPSWPAHLPLLPMSTLPITATEAITRARPPRLSSSTQLRPRLSMKVPKLEVGVLEVQALVPAQHTEEEPQLDPPP